MDYDPQQNPITPTTPNQNPQNGGQPPYNGNSYPPPQPPAYPQPPAPSYGYQPPYVQDQKPANNGLCTASMIIGIVSLLFSCCLYYLALPAGIVGLILGIVGVRKQDANKTMGIVGIVLCSLAIVVSICMIIFIVVMLAASEDYSSFYSTFQ